MLLAISHKPCRIIPIRNISLPFKSSKSKIGESKVHVVSSNPALKRDADQRDVTSMDLLEERIRQRSFVRQSTFCGQTQSWNYRSEIVDKLGLDNKHRNIWIAYAVIIVFGFTAFVYVKSKVISNRREEMEQRHRIRREMKMNGNNNEKLGSTKLSVVDS